MFDAFWPKATRQRQNAQAASVHEIAQPSLDQPAEHQADAAVAVEREAPVPAPPPAPVSVLKSGVVDGMAYTLYSDGSIVAQLPEGTLRFASITELRNHIDQGS
jgi:hypothetical protein